MNAKQLLAHFEHLAEVPNALPRLRRFILDLAVRGKLVEQDVKDESAPELLARIKEEKLRLANEGLGKKEKPLPYVDIDESPFVIPHSWSWTRLQDITSYIQRGKSPNYSTSDGVPVISQKCVQWRGLDLSAARLITTESLGKYELVRFLRDEDLLWNSTGTGTIGRVVRVISPPENLVCDSHVTVVRCALVNSEYVRSWLASDHVYGNIEYRAAGATNQVELNSSMAAQQLVPLPPLAEQHRIVAKVDELMALCDQLEAAQQERHGLRDRLAAASLRRLNPSAANTPLEVQREYARFHLHHLPRLVTRPEHIKALRQTILNLAVRGAFSENNEWSLYPQPLKTAATLQNGYAFKSEWFAKTGIRLLRNTNVSHGVLRWDELECLPIEQADEFERFKLKEGDVVLSLDRPFIGTGTKVARVRASDLPCLLLQRVGRFQLNPDLLTSDYLFLWIQSPQFTDQIDPGRSNGVPHISSKQVEAAEIFLPPLTEQHHIVTKVDELMALCDQLDAQLAMAHACGRQMLDAVLDGVLGIVRAPKDPSAITSPSPILDSDLQIGKASRFMATNPAMTIDQLVECIDDMGGSAIPERLLTQAGLGEDVEAFYDLLRAARDSGKVTVPLGSGEIVRRHPNAD